jgi:hypothetical protein
MNDPRESMEDAPLLVSSHGRYSMFRNGCAAQAAPAAPSCPTLPKLSLPAEQVGAKPGWRDSEVSRQCRWRRVRNAIMSALTTLHAR